jgi:putative tryptophan/tyrosine transport system substrate-binding protein
MKRREFMTILGGAAAGASAAWPFAARALQPGKTSTIGFLGVNTTAWAPWTAAFVERLRTLGWIEGRTIAIEYRWSEGRPEKYPDLAAEFARLKVDVIVTSAAAVPAVTRAAPSTPVVFTLALDPVGVGLVRSLARPGGNVTGNSVLSTDLAGKRLELLRETVPGLRRLAIMADAGLRESTLEANEVLGIARNLDIEVTRLDIHSAEDIIPAFEICKAQAHALYVVIDELLNASRARIVDLALATRLPSIYGTGDWTRSGGLLSYGPNFQNLFARAAELTDKILRGTPPADIPVEQPTKFELLINLKTARALGIAIPPNLLAIADEVVE